MQKIIAYEMYDGAVNIVDPASETRRMRVEVLPGGTVREEAESDDEHIARVSIERRPDGAVGLPRIVAATDLPPNEDDLSRQSWIFDASGRVVIDITKARDTYLNRLRQVRDALLQATDGPAFRAAEQGNLDQVATLRELRRRLRDLPSDLTARFDAAVTPQELRSIVPSVIAEAIAVVRQGFPRTKTVA